jgi:hypothetical protein
MRASKGYAAVLEPHRRELRRALSTRGGTPPSRQAIDRSHRIGQDRTVIAYRLLTRGTIEEKIWELQQREAALSRELLGEDGLRM